MGTNLRTDRGSSDGVYHMKAALAIIGILLIAGTIILTGAVLWNTVGPRVGLIVVVLGFLSIPICNGILGIVLIKHMADSGMQAHAENSTYEAEAREARRAFGLD